MAMWCQLPSFIAAQEAFTRCGDMPSFMMKSSSVPEVTQWIESDLCATADRSAPWHRIHHCTVRTDYPHHFRHRGVSEKMLAARLGRLHPKRKRQIRGAQRGDSRRRKDHARTGPVKHGRFNGRDRPRDVFKGDSCSRGANVGPSFAIQPPIGVEIGVVKPPVFQTGCNSIVKIALRRGLGNRNQRGGTKGRVGAPSAVKSLLDHLATPPKQEERQHDRQDPLEAAYRHPFIRRVGCCAGWMGRGP